MNFVLYLLQTVAVMLPASLVAAALTGALLWRLRRWGLLSVLLGLAVFAALDLAVWAVAPGLVRPGADGRTPPVALGLAVGWGLPMVAFVLYHLRGGRWP